MKSNVPLNALKAFEAAARHGGYVTAAAELGVSAAAVSQHVRRLEQHLGRKLFLRFNNRIQLTDAGQTISQGIATALEDISEMMSRTQSGITRRRLVVSTLASLGDCWLMPSLETFCAANTGARIEIRIEDDPVDLAGQQIDLRLCYGVSLYQEHVSVPLFADRVLPLCSPQFLARLDSQPIDWRGLAGEHFIHTEWGPSFVSQPGWGEWFQRYCPGTVPDIGLGHRVNRSRLALDFARRGLGLALGQHGLAQEDLLAGRLVAASHHSIELGHIYCAVYPHSKSSKPLLRKLLDWLQERSTERRQTQPPHR